MVIPSLFMKEEDDPLFMEMVIGFRNGRGGGGGAGGGGGGGGGGLHLCFSRFFF